MYSPKYTFHKKMYYVALTLFIVGLIALFLYHYFDYRFYGLRPTCASIAYFHCYCPGCGGTRALDAFLHGRLLESFLCHPVILYVFGMFLAYFIPATYTFFIKRDGNLYYKYHNASLWGLLSLIIINFIGRNILLIFFHLDYLQDCIGYYLV